MAINIVIVQQTHSANHRDLPPSARHKKVKQEIILDKRSKTLNSKHFPELLASFCVIINYLVNDLSNLVIQFQ